MSTSQKRKHGIRCQHVHPDNDGPCDLLLLEKQGKTVGISDKFGHFTSIEVLYNEAIRRGWTPNTEATNETEKTVTSPTPTSNRYADRGQIDALNAALKTGTNTDYIGSSIDPEQHSCRGVFTGNVMYLMERSGSRRLIRRIEILPEGDSSISLEGILISVTQDSLEEVHNSEHSDNRPLNEHEAEELIAAFTETPTRS